jgi:hypothetical protein
VTSFAVMSGAVTSFRGDELRSDAVMPLRSADDM